MAGEIPLGQLHAARKRVRANRRMVFGFTTFESMTPRDQRAHYDAMEECQKHCHQIVDMLLAGQQVDNLFLLNLLTRKRQTL